MSRESPNKQKSTNRIEWTRTQRFSAPVMNEGVNVMEIINRQMEIDISLCYRGMQESISHE